MILCRRFFLILASVDNVYQTLKTVLDHISKLHGVRLRCSATRRIFSSLSSVSKFGQARSFVFNI